VLLKELMDNSLDACEEAGVAPVISIAVTNQGSVTIQDNGGGIETDTIKSILDYTIRVSSREAYVSPTRGAQGNALKTLLAMGYVLDRERGETKTEAVGVTIIETRRVRHRIEFRVDHVNNQPKIVHTTEIGCGIDKGTKVIVQWPDNDLFDSVRDKFREMAESYTWFNPHLTLSATWGGEKVIDLEATDSNWHKWGPCDPTSPHWYDE
jgi:DNA topoisomerase VI subunit B